MDLTIVENTNTEIAIADVQTGLDVVVEIVVCALSETWDLKSRDAVQDVPEGKVWRGILRANSGNSIRFVPRSTPASIVYGYRILDTA